MKVDLHVHTNFSLDSSVSFGQIGDVFDKGVLDRIAITDHNRMDGALKLKEIYGDKIIVGEEISSSAGHIIGLFMKEPIEKGLTIQETVRRIKKQGALVYLPHVYDEWRHGLGEKRSLEIMKDVDIIENFNSRGTRRSNMKSEAFAERFDKAKATSSDAHRKTNLGRAYSDIPDFSDAKTLLESLKSPFGYKAKRITFSLITPTIIRMRRRLSQFFYEED
ncbi:PHP domain-containing protein [Candidatus Dojkabacteria bacterium]|nr:PHP domain-containing protein [Candidatus Dojkabacteria bacterium]